MVRVRVATGARGAAVAGPLRRTRHDGHDVIERQLVHERTQLQQQRKGLPNASRGSDHTNFHSVASRASG